MHSMKSKQPTDNFFSHIDYSSLEMRTVAAYAEADAKISLSTLYKMSPRKRMTIDQPVRYLGHTYSSRERKD